ncbi:MAG: hypothetical protein UEL03_08485 [Clostridium sp.]|uniref:hypothetical protein n=1 Tax=Clostridium sp. TaxID=1506 RepID=UPI002E7A70CF|nr:hypothetical protein [Clostridium sp.]MEE0131407.1 hypothetical protein [Clostridium sp.]
MKKSTFLKIAGVSAMLSIMASMPAFAGKWKLDEQNKWYWYGEVSTANSWKWLDGNNDGIYECYYFDENSHPLMNVITPDGYQVNGDGPWVVNGVVQTKTLSDEIDFIRSTYAYTNAHIGEYQAKSQPTDLFKGYSTDGSNTFYYTQSGTLVKQIARLDTMTVEIYHLNPALGRSASTDFIQPETTAIFAFAYDKAGNEYRVYLKDAEVIRCIGPDKVVHDFPRGLIYGEFVRSSLYPNPELQSYVYKEQIEEVLRTISPFWYQSYEFNERDMEEMKNFVW